MVTHIFGKILDAVCAGKLDINVLMYSVCTYRVGTVGVGMSLDVELEIRIHLVQLIRPHVLVQ